MRGPAPDISRDESDDRFHEFSFRQRVLLQFITWAGILAIRLIGPTLRYSVSFEEGAPAGLDARPVVCSFWHCCVFPAAYITRKRKIRVLTSRSFDGEYIARIIHHFGFVPIRGSSSRGAVGGLLALRREVEDGATAAFTLDGPRGPRYVAKPGPVQLAKMTGAPMSAFHVGLENPWVLRTWDRLMIPRPFSRALFRLGRQIHVPADADDRQIEAYLAELQALLDRVREFAEQHVHRVGSDDFPLSRG